MIYCCLVIRGLDDGAADDAAPGCGTTETTARPEAAHGGGAQRRHSLRNRAEGPLRRCGRSRRFRRPLGRGTRGRSRGRRPRHRGGAARRHFLSDRLSDGLGVSDVAVGRGKRPRGWRLRAGRACSHLTSISWTVTVANACRGLCRESSLFSITSSTCSLLSECQSHRRRSRRRRATRGDCLPEARLLRTWQRPPGDGQLWVRHPGAQRRAHPLG
ncbi:hypothetical protein BD626DRAFT_183889 [Schizophyllum amplum]|uniref:Uncharacterized protein n=1 Tax=Schizophyllum amplum TaxID=97359 RepID=A0A550C170_9AGAR|nr:hypothetical protein BD626DRAFT_183889 [Auriculariopsis ampla]